MFYRKLLYLNFILSLSAVVLIVNPLNFRSYTAEVALAVGDWVNSGSNIYFNTGNVGIGITAPGAKLHTKVSTAGTTGIANARQRAAGFFEGNSTSTWGLAIGQDNNVEIPIIQGLDLAQTNPRNIALNPYGGNVGIGTTTPQSKLEINGNILLSGAGGGEAIIYASSPAGEANAALIADGGMSFYIDHDNDSGGSEAFYFRKDAGATFLMTILESGNVGIGTTSPAAKLEVNGAIRLTPLASDPSGLTNGMMWMRQ